MDKFQPGKRYIFSKAKWLADTANVWVYEDFIEFKKWADGADGKEVEIISKDGYIAKVDGFTVTPKSCDIAKPYLHEVFGQAVKRLLHEDREDKILERINMIEDEINELEMNITILKDEQDNLLEELKFINDKNRKSEDLAWRHMKGV